MYQQLDEANWRVAQGALGRGDSRMRRLVRLAPGERVRSRGRAFETLFRSIVGQQISVLAAQAVWDRIRSHLRTITPASVLATPEETFRRLGLSSRKAEYVRDLAAAFVDRRIQVRRWRRMADEDIIRELVQVRGIGRWTAEMFLIFHLLRPNVFPRDDLGLQKAIHRVYGCKYPMSARQLDLFERKFQPWCSVATWYLWRSLDPIPVAY